MKPIMNPFEKIFNHQIMARLHHSGIFTVTSHERAWLKTMLQSQTAADAFSPGTLDKLHSILEADQAMDTSRHLIEKARSAEKQIYHSLLQPLRRSIRNNDGIRMTYEVKGGHVHSEHSGFPYKLEYSMVKREWYLLWYHCRRHQLMSTRLNSIQRIEPEAVAPAEAAQIKTQIAVLLHSDNHKVVIEIVPLYNEELSRMLYAFSSFEKNVAYNAERDTYRVSIYLSHNETEYLLSKIRFLGKRVRVVESDAVKKRMLQSATKALARYSPPHESE